MKTKMIVAIYNVLVICMLKVVWKWRQGLQILTAIVVTTWLKIKT